MDSKNCRLVRDVIHGGHSVVVQGKTDKGDFVTIGRIVVPSPIFQARNNTGLMVQDFTDVDDAVKYLCQIYDEEQDGN